MPESAFSFNTNRLFPALALLTWLLVTAILLHFHEPWRDELQSWAIAKESHSLTELLHFSRYEGHPSAWYILLFAFTRLSTDFQVVQWVHLCIAGAVAALILFKSPFSRLQKILAIGGYFLLYEYAILSRNYAIGILLGCCVCIFLKGINKCWVETYRRTPVRRAFAIPAELGFGGTFQPSWKMSQHWLALVACLFFMLQCNVFSAILACAFFCLLLFSGAKIARRNAAFRLAYFVGILIFIAGFALAWLDMKPPAGTTFMPEWTWEKPAVERAIGSFFHALVPVPRLEPGFWNSHILASVVKPGILPEIETALGVTLLFACIYSLRKCPAGLAFFFLSWLAITVFLSVKYAGFMRHHGHYFLVYFFAFWLKNDVGGNRKTRMNLFFTLILAVHFLAIIPAAYFDIKHPFSQSQNIAAYLRNNYPDRQLAGHFDYATSPVSFHLDKPIFYPNAWKTGTFILWNTERMKREVPDVTLVINDMCHEIGSYLLITNYSIPPEKMGDSIRLLRSFAPAIVASETYHLHEINCPKWLEK